MATQNTILQGIADIEPPSVPVTTDVIDITGLTASILVMLIFAFTVFLAWRNYTSRRSRARRYLSALRSRFQNGHSDVNDTHDVAFKVANILRQGLNLRHITQHIPVPESFTEYGERWQRYNTLLSQARYAPGNISVDQLILLLDDTEFWLRRWPRS